jgi:PhnB protein
MAEVANRRAGFHSVTPRMFVGDLESAVSFLRTVFGAVGEVHAGRPAEIGSETHS